MRLNLDQRLVVDLAEVRGVGNHVEVEVVVRHRAVLDHDLVHDALDADIGIFRPERCDEAAVFRAALIAGATQGRA